LVARLLRINYVQEKAGVISTNGLGMGYHEVRLYFFAVPIVVLFTLVANRRDVKDSWRWAESGERLRTIKVLELPLNEFCSKYVSFELRYGMCLSPLSPFSPKAAITSPSALKLLLIFCVSRTRSLSAPFAKLTFNLSLPARSTRFKLPSHRSPVPAHPSTPTLTPLMRKVKTECEREDRSFINVAATLRRDWARERRDRT